MPFDRLGIVAYETPFAPCGGVAAVMKFLPPALASVTGQRVAVFTPLHHRVPQAPNLPPTTLVAAFAVPLGPRQVVVNLRHWADGEVDWYFLAADQPDLFAGRRDPYANAAELTRDAVFFGAAVARAIWMLAPGRPWALHLIDWQAATTALALAAGGSVAPHRLQLCLHNSYDAELRYYDLNQVGLQPADCPPAHGATQSTVLLRALPLVCQEVCTVSGQFARDLLHEPLHARILAAHLQPHLLGRLVGIDDGVFAPLSMPAEFLDGSYATVSAELISWKAQRWQAAVEALREVKEGPDHPVWGDRVAFVEAAATGDLVPLVMGGRDDAQQKGYDVCAEAVERLLQARCPAQFVLLPLPGATGLGGLDYLREMAASWPGRVLVLPFRFAGYADLLAGAAYGLMPSLYEPFGSAHEFYLAGSAGIARATGGLVQQIVPVALPGALDGSARAIAAPWHPAHAEPTGYLFREDAELSASPEEWWRLRAAHYGAGGHRQHLPLFGSMVEALVETTQAAVELYQATPQRYAQMVLRGARLVLDSFTWDRAAQAYLDALDA